MKIIPGFGQATVLVDGHDVSNHVTRVSFDQRGGQLPEVFLELSPRSKPDDIECEAVVHVVREVPEDAAAATARFLEAIDADELDRCVLATMELDGPQTYGAACLEVMRAWARGD